MLCVCVCGTVRAKKKERDHSSSPPIHTAKVFVAHLSRRVISSLSVLSCVLGLSCLGRDSVRRNCQNEDAVFVNGYPHASERNINVIKRCEPN